MIVSPLDYELYSRVTGQPMPMSAAERMKMAPVVNEFTKNYTKSQNRQAMGRNILKIGALGALGVMGARAFGTPSQELGQEITKTSTAANLIENAAEKAAQSVGSNTVTQSLATDQTPSLTEENAVETADEPSQLNINAALEREDAPLLDAGGIREKYSPYTRKTSPEERQERNLAAMVGGGEILLDVPKKKGEVVKTKEAQLYDDKGEKELLGKYVGMMKKGVDPTLKEVSGQTTENYGPELLVDDSFGSPLTDHPDVAGGEDDINLPGIMNTSATTNLSSKVLGISVSLPENLGSSPEEKLIIANEIDKKRQLNPLEQRAVDNEAAMGSMRLSDEERKKESIRLGSTGGIPNKTDMAEIRKDPEYIAAQESMKPKSTAEKVDDFTAKFVEGAKSDIVRGRMGNKSLGITRIPPTNGDSQVGFVLANKPVDQSPKFAETYAYGVAPGAEDIIKGSLDDKTFSTYMQRAMKESKQGKKRQAGEIFEYLIPDARVIEGTAMLGDIEM